MLNLLLEWRWITIIKVANLNLLDHEIMFKVRRCAKMHSFSLVRKSIDSQNWMLTLSVHSHLS